MRKFLVLLALGVVAAGLLTATSSAAASSSCAVAPSDGFNRFGNAISGLAISGSAACAVHNTSDPARGVPPLLYNGGPIMPTNPSAPTVVTPIFWSPVAHPVIQSYKGLITRYLRDVAASSGSNTNVFSVQTEYYGTNGNVGNQIVMGTPIIDYQALPRSDCQVASNDTTGIYADGTGYFACLDDTQLTYEIQRLINTRGLPQNDYSHIYAIFTPKGVESCFYKGSTLTSANACTINHQPSAAYCAYHSMMGNNWPSFGTIYANMPFPIYSSPVGYTCGTDAGNFLGGLQSPNHNLDADTEISPLSHEMTESMTDPNVFNGWFDAAGYENGDECAYTWGPTSGAFGQEYNQVINGHQYITQEEFSNIDFFHTGGGCVQSQSAEG